MNGRWQDSEDWASQNHNGEVARTPDEYISRQPDHYYRGNGRGHRPPYPDDPARVAPQQRPGRPVTRRYDPAATPPDPYYRDDYYRDDYYRDDAYYRGNGPGHRPPHPDDSARVAPEQGSGRPVTHRYDLPEVRIKSTRPLLWIALFDVAALGVVRHVLFFFWYKNYVLLMCTWAAIFLLTSAQWFVSWRERPFKVTPQQWEKLNRMRVAVNIPVYNEDPALLDRALYALFTQTRLPDEVEVVDDGSAVDYSSVRRYWRRYHPPGCRLTWVRQENQGKKHAQARTFRHTNAEILVTLDSDTALDRRAIEEGLKPFADRRVQSVAGLEIAYNHHRNFLTRISGTRSLIWQLLSCSAQSVFGDVLVNRGTFALYRAPVIQDNLDAYLYETFFGLPVHLGDDAALTLFARGRGRAVQQPTAIQLTMYPESLSHLLRQWIRWMRGSTIRTFWRIRYLRVLTWSWWFTVLSLWTFFASTAATLAAAILWPSSRPYLVMSLLASAVSSYALAVRIFSVVRSDESWFARFFSFLLAPIVGLWVLLILRPLRFYGIFTCMRQGWVTRVKRVEVGIGSASPAVSSSRPR